MCNGSSGGTCGYKPFGSFSSKTKKDRGYAWNAFLLQHAFDGRDPSNLDGSDNAEFQRKYQEARQILVSHALKLHFQTVLSLNARAVVYKEMGRCGLNPIQGNPDHWELYRNVIFDKLECWPNLGDPKVSAALAAHQIAKVKMPEKYVALVNFLEQERCNLQRNSGLRQPFYNAVQDVMNRKRTCRAVGLSTQDQHSWAFILGLHAGQILPHDVMAVWRETGVIDNEGFVRPKLLKSRKKNLGRSTRPARPDG